MGDLLREADRRAALVDQAILDDYRKHLLFTPEGSGLLSRITGLIHTARDLSDAVEAGSSTSYLRRRLTDLATSVRESAAVLDADRITRKISVEQKAREGRL